MNKEIQKMLDQLDEIRKVYPNFGYLGRAGWVDEDEAGLDEWDVGE